MRTLLALALFLSMPIASAQYDPFAPPAPFEVTDVRAREANQRVDLSWDAPSDPVDQYIVYVYYNGQQEQNRTVSNATQATFFLTNGRTYVFQVAAMQPDGNEGPRSRPIAATPHFQNDLAYLAAGLIAVWVGLFGYAAFLARKEASIDHKLEQLLQARFHGRSP